MARLPDALSLECRLSPPDFSVAARAVVDALSSCALPALRTWAIPADAADSRGDLEADLRWASEPGGRIVTMRLELAGGGSGVLGADPRGQGWRLHLSCGCGSDAEHCLGLLVGLHGLCRALLGAGVLAQARLRRIGAGLDCLPRVPIAGTCHLVVTDRPEVDAEYQDSAAFWGAGWESETYGDRVLLRRGMQCADGAQYLAEIQDAQWAMARAARPGRTGYFAPRLLPDEEPVFFAGEPRLVPVGHSALGRSAEFAAVLDPDQHLRGWEVFDLRALVRNKALPDGRPVEVVQVVFSDRSAAERERRPLLDVGARVLFRDTLDLVELAG